jgi:hypothetical protein
MKLLLYSYVCAHGHVFEEGTLPPGEYGTFLLRSVTGKTAVVFAIDSPEYEEVSDIVDKLLSGLRDVDRAPKLKAVFGATCDRASDGTILEVEAKPPCSICGSTQMASWQRSDPRRYIDVEIPTVTHLEWHRLSADQRVWIVQNALAQLPQETHPGDPTQDKAGDPGLFRSPKF